MESGEGLRECGKEAGSRRQRDPRPWRAGRRRQCGLGGGRGGSALHVQSLKESFAVFEANCC